MVFLVGPWAVGAQSRQRADRAEAAETRAAQLEREQELQAALVAADERTRIARELHDIVSHSISVVTIQVQAVRRRLGPEHAAEAADLAQVEATARQALNEMRRLFGVLRAEGEQAALEPQPGLDPARRPGRPGPRRRARRAARRRGRAPAAAAGHRPGGVPHRPGGAHQRPASLRVPREVTVGGPPRAGRRSRCEVRDNGRGLQRTKNPGHGLVGVRERVALYDGTVEVANGPGRRRLPHRDAADGTPGMSAPIRVVIVDDQGMVRAGFTSLLATEPDIEVVGDAADGEAGGRARHAGSSPT